MAESGWRLKKADTPGNRTSFLSHPRNPMRSPSVAVLVAALSVTLCACSSVSQTPVAAAPAVSPALKTRPVEMDGHLESRHPGWEKRSVDVKIAWLEIEGAKTPELREAANEWLESRLSTVHEDSSADVDDRDAADDAADDGDEADAADADCPECAAKIGVDLSGSGGVGNEDAGEAPRQEVAAQAYMRDCIRDWCGHIEFQEDAASFQYENDAKAQVAFDDGKWVTLKTDVYGYSGGAHGGTRVSVASFNADTGEAFDLKESLTQEGEKALRKWMLPRLRHAIAQDDVDRTVWDDGKPADAVEKAEADDPFFPEAFDKDGLLPWPAEIGLVKEGLLLQYNQYEITPYCFGSPSVVIPWKDLKPFAKAGGPLAR